MIRTKYIVVSSHVFILLNEIMSEAFSRLGESGHGKTSFFYIRHPVFNKCLLKEIST